MGYLSLYRKWRPKTFDDLAGQKTVVKTLKNAIEHNRISHAYLFCGPRGTGKTSAAKAFAKALNCEKGPTVNPCNQCFSCEQINSGRSVDVIEIDAASNRRIDEIRDLREKVKFSPSEGDYKVYIIDEVHMLTKEAFNALLKTLEEPPKNVVFILATTEPHKILPTIISRCQRFDFGLLSIQDLSKRMKYICEQEKISVSDGALTMIARSAEGGMRDAISILDQAIAFGGDRVNIEDVNTILGKVDQQILKEIVMVMASHDTKRGLELVNKIIDQGKDIHQFVKDLILHFRDLMLVKECGVQNNIIDLPEEFKLEQMEQAQNFKTSDLLKILEMLSDADQQLRFASQPRLILELTLIKLLSPEVDTSMTNLINRLAKVEEMLESRPSIQERIIVSPKPEVAPVQKIQEKVASQSKINKNVEVKETTKEVLEVAQPAKEESIKEQGVKSISITKDELENYWKVTLDFLNKKSETRKLRAFLLKGKPYAIVGNTIYIVFPQSSTFHKAHAEEEIDKLELVLKKVIGQTVHARCIFEGEEGKIPKRVEEREAGAIPSASEIQDRSEENKPIKLTREQIENDPIVQKTLKYFGGKIIGIEDVDNEH